MSTTPPIEPLVSSEHIRELRRTRSTISVDPWHAYADGAMDIRALYESERAELIRQRDEAEERTKLVLEQVTIIINAFAAKMKKVNAESGVDFSQLEAIAANPRFTEKAREIAAKALSTPLSPPNR